MMIVDAQVHVWAAGTVERPWPAAHPDTPLPHSAEPLTADDLSREMEAAGVDRAVLVSPSFEGLRNDVVLAAAQAHPTRFAVMGRIDPTALAPRELLPASLRHPGVLALRFAFVHGQRRALLVDGRVDWLWPQAEKEGVPLMLYVEQADLHLIDKIAGRHPDLRLTIDHLAVTGGKDQQAFREFDKLLPLARHENVAVKVTCLPLYTTDVYPYRWLHPYLRRVYDTFGPQRMFWGSDLSRLPCSYREVVTMFTEEIPWLTPEDKEWIMGRSLCEWLGWELPQT